MMGAKRANEQAGVTSLPRGLARATAISLSSAPVSGSNAGCSHLGSMRDVDAVGRDLGAPESLSAAGTLGGILAEPLDKLSPSTHIIAAERPAALSICHFSGFNVRTPQVAAAQSCQHLNSSRSELLTP